MEAFAVDLFVNSMLYRMLTVSPSSSPSSSSSSPFPLRSSALLGHSDCCQVAAEASMESLCLRPEEEEVWAEFSVDELLNFEFVENEKEAEKEEDDDETEEQKEVEEESNSSTYSSSAVGCLEQPPLGLHGIGLPAHDAEEFEWVSLIMDDSLSEFPSPSGIVSSPPVAAAAAQSRENAGSRSPTSVSPAVCILSTEAMVPIKAKRSKRSRSTAASAAAWSMSGPRLFPESASDSTTTTTTSSSSMSSCSSPAMSSYLIHRLPPPAAGQTFLPSDGPPPSKKQKKKKRGRKPKPLSSTAAPAPGERRCAHCGAQKTPQWRAGPLGAKTLCNACGVRFKSGRLLPEYRPACSPSFVSHIHSNCHRKVLEMRRNKGTELISAPAAPPPPVQSF